MKNLTVSFDNLAIEQLNVKRFFTPERWNQFYMGDDGTFTCYVDLVEQKYAMSSTSVDKYPIGDMNIKEVFKIIRENRRTIETQSNANQ